MAEVLVQLIYFVLIYVEKGNQLQSTDLSIQVWDSVLRK